MKESAQAPRFEPPWPVALALLAVIFLLALLPMRVSLVLIWLPYLLGGALLVPMAAVALTAEKAQWLRFERAIMLLIVVITGGGTVVNLANLAMFESAISLATIVVVVARAINILGS